MSLRFHTDPPADVPVHAYKAYTTNYAAITKDTGKLLLFVCDQKIEHLAHDFYGPGIPAEVLDPEHVFRIAHQGTIGAFATNLGLIERYGTKYPGIRYIAKLNGKTDLVDAKVSDPMSAQLWSVDDVLAVRQNSNIAICGVGMMVYIGSTYESAMLAQAAQMIKQAHEHGLITILWVYARGKSITQENDPELIIGAVGLAAALGSDFVKIKVPAPRDNKSAAEWLTLAATAAGNTKVLCSGGPRIEPALFLDTLYDQIHSGNTAGCATGRNIFQHPLAQAIAMTEAIASIVWNNATPAQALGIIEKSKK